MIRPTAAAMTTGATDRGLEMLAEMLSEAAASVAVENHDETKNGAPTRGRRSRSEVRRVRVEPTEG